MYTLESPQNSGSDELIALDEDKKAASLLAIAETYHALQFVQDAIKSDRLTVGTRHNGFGLAKIQFDKLHALLDVEEDERQRKELNERLLRRANAEIHRLNEELGKKASVEGLANKLHQLNQMIYTWWQELGFTYCKSMIVAHFQGATFDVDFSVSVDRHLNHTERENTPVSSRQAKDSKIDSMKSELDLLNDNGEIYVLDHPQNREWIISRIQDRFPNARIANWESCSIRNNNREFQIRRVKAFIDLTDIEVSDKEGA